MLSRTSNMQMCKRSIWIQPDHYMSNSHGSAHNATRQSHISKRTLWNSIFMEVHCEAVCHAFIQMKTLPTYKLYVLQICRISIHTTYTDHIMLLFLLPSTWILYKNIWLNNNVCSVCGCYDILQTLENYATVVIWTWSMSFDVWTILFTPPMPLLLSTSRRCFLLVNKICLLQHINFTQCHSEIEWHYG